eukprot:TRINITY_DN1231_c0_g2_i4.p1 TRINITY_DN1231_c0_g2~~TRINITY_DN1231_c0_g2_i4.p1  ORF type:complete len:796 (+),score=169.96 TRINITY_DN1231_c0_g2_i4:726-3113(+)
MWALILFWGLFVDVVEAQGCSDVLPEWSWYDCQQQKDYYKCDEQWMKTGNYCAKTCGRCSDETSIQDEAATTVLTTATGPLMSDCVDVAPDQWYTCNEQKEFGKCSDWWFNQEGFCAKTCGLCADGEQMACTDIAPDQYYTCEEQKNFGKCDSWDFKTKRYCDRACGRCFSQPQDSSTQFVAVPVESTTAAASVIEQSECSDVRGDFMWYTCEEEKSFGKCEEWWMQEANYCAKTCGRCTPTTADLPATFQQEEAVSAFSELKRVEYEGKYDYEQYYEQYEAVESVLQVQQSNDNAPLSDTRIKQLEQELEQCQNELANDYVDVSGDSSFVRTSGVQFVKEGQSFPFVGFNFHDLMKVAANESTRYRVELAFQKASEMNLKVCRVFAFTDGENWQPEFFDLIRGTSFWQEPRALQQQPGVFDEQMFQALDYVVHMASQYGILLLPVMTNYWPGYGGAAQYIKWIHGSHTTNGHTIDEFYSNYKPRMLLKRFMCELVSRKNTISGLRYRDDPTIMGWSLINEARCPECSGSEPKDQILYDWISDMSSFLKSIDKNHLVSAGTEGFFGKSSPEFLRYNPGGWPNCEGTDFMRQHQLPNIDFATIRMYDRLKTWDYENHRACNHECFVKWAEQNILGHLKAAQQLNKPLVIEEFGELVAEQTDKKERNHILHLVLQTMFNSAVAGGPGMGAMFWQAGVSGSVDWDNYTIYLDSSPKIHTPLYTLDFTTQEETSFRREPQQTACYPSQDVVWEADYYANKQSIELTPLRVPEGIKRLSDLEVIKLHAGNFAALRTSIQL